MKKLFLITLSTLVLSTAAQAAKDPSVCEAAFGKGFDAMGSFVLKSGESITICSKSNGGFSLPEDMAVSVKPDTQIVKTYRLFDSSLYEAPKNTKFYVGMPLGVNSMKQKDLIVIQLLEGKEVSKGRYAITAAISTSDGDETVTTIISEESLK